MIVYTIDNKPLHKTMNLHVSIEMQGAITAANEAIQRRCRLNDGDGLADLYEDKNAAEYGIHLTIRILSSLFADEDHMLGTTEDVRKEVHDVLKRALNCMTQDADAIVSVQSMVQKFNFRIKTSPALKET